MARPKREVPVQGEKAYVFSTLANDQNYTFWAKGGGDIQIEERRIFVAGGTGVANDRLITPIGTATEISVDDIVHLENHPVFKMHKENGYVTIQRTSADPEKVAADMNLKDESAPLTDSDMGEGENDVKRKD